MSTGQAADYFSLFGLPRAATLDNTLLSERYHLLQNQVHPDKFAGATDMERQLALQQASRINAAYVTLNKPLTRAAYLLSLYGVDVFAETNTAMPVDFLEQQFIWREALMEADDAQTAAIKREISDAQSSTAAQAATALAQVVESNGTDDTAKQAAYDLLRCWTYLDKLLA